MKNLYLVTGIKRYPAYTGDSIEDTIKILIPAPSTKEAELIVTGEGKIDKVSDETILLYSLKNEEFADITYIV